MVTQREVNNLYDTIDPASSTDMVIAAALAGIRMELTAIRQVLERGR